MSDEALRILKRGADHDPRLKDAYIAALERRVYGTTTHGDDTEIQVYIVVQCHETTKSDDVWVCATADAAWRTAAEESLKQLEAINRDDPELLTNEALASVQQLLLQNKFRQVIAALEEIQTLYFYEIEAKKIII